jgi:hypothetical protein
LILLVAKQLTAYLENREDGRIPLNCAIFSGSDNICETKLGI